MSKSPGKLYVITPDGSLPAQEFPKGHELKDLQTAVGGSIERVRIRFEGKVRDAYVNEDGIAQGLPPNRAATRLLAPPFHPAVNQLFGNVAIWVPTPKPSKAARAEQKNADHVDGYDRDDIGESSDS